MGNRHAHNNLRRIAKMAKESGIRPDCLVKRALDELAGSSVYQRLVEAHQQTRAYLRSGRRPHRTG